MRQIALSILVTGLISTSALAQEPSSRLVTRGALAGLAFTSAADLTEQTATPAAAPAPPPKKVVITTGADVPTLYVFRGIRQEYDPQFTIQPFIDFGVTVNDTTTVNFGSWNSFHSGSNKDNGTRGLHSWYESDIYGIATFTVGKAKPGVQWTSYTSPNDDYKTVNELAFFLGFDDSKNALPVSPKVLVGFETTDGQADAGLNKGIYFELSGKPSHKLGSSPVTLNIPLRLGMSLKDYYETVTVDPITLVPTSTDSKFGYFDIGANISVPVGIGEIHGGIDFYTFGDTLKGFNVSKSNPTPSSTQPVGSIGFTVTF
jgi:hypothetical protein